MPWKTAMYFNRPNAAHVVELRPAVAHYTRYHSYFYLGVAMAHRRKRKHNGWLGIHLHLAKYELKEVST